MDCSPVSCSAFFCGQALFSGAGGPESAGAAEAMDQATVAFRGTAGGGGGEVESGLALLGKFTPRFAARFGFAVELLRDGSRPADAAQAQDFDFEVAALIFDRQQIADANFA